MKMKKTFFMLVFVFIVWFCVIDGLAFGESSEQGLPVHNVDTGLDYLTIQGAIDANETLDGHTIMVDAGVYYEHLMVHKAVSLVGENGTETFVDGNGTGTVVYITADNVKISGFTVQNGGNVTGCSGIHVADSVGVNISRNIIRNNLRGIFVMDSSNTVLWGNEVSNGEYGIRLYYSSNNVLWGVKVSNNSRGIYFGYSDNNVLSGNVISDNEEGIRMFVSSGNVIFHNNFVNDTKPVVSVDSVNSWDNGVEGNYWSGYEGIDEDQDGIGDTPFIINENNTDSFPLMGMVSDLNVVYEHEMFRVSVVCNSTVSEFGFDVAAMMLGFNVMGVNDTVGFCRVMVPKVLVNWPYVVLVDGEQINSTVLPVSNYTHTFLYFTYMLSGHEVRIISKPYYQLLERYNNILAEYQKLNLTYYELLDGYGELLVSFELLNATYQGLLAQYHNLNLTYYELLDNYTVLLDKYNQLEDDYNALNATYYEILGNYTELQGNYDSLNSTYNTLNSAYNNLVADYNHLNATFNEYKRTHSYSDSEFNTVVAYRDYWIAEYDSLNVTYHSLQANYTDLQVDYDNLQADFNSLNYTYNNLKSEQQATISELNYVRNLMYVFVVTTVGAVILVSFSMRYYRMFSKQKKVVERYERELGRLSPLEIARVLFKADVERREVKIGRFEEKYGVRVRPRRTLEDVIKRLELKKKAEE